MSLASAKILGGSPDSFAEKAWSPGRVTSVDVATLPGNSGTYPRDPYKDLEPEH